MVLFSKVTISVKKAPTKAVFQGLKFLREALAQNTSRQQILIMLSCLSFNNFSNHCSAAFTINLEHVNAIKK